jgi:PilZ domain
MGDRFSISSSPDAGSRFPGRRSVPRFEFIAPVEIIDPVSKTHISGSVTEISERGCFVEIPNPLPVNSVIQLRIRRDDGLFETWGRVMHSRHGIGMGLFFIRTAPGQTKLLKTWISGLEEKPNTVEYLVEVISCYAKRKEDRTRTPYPSEAEARAAYDAQNLAGIAEDIERTHPGAGLTFIWKRLLRIHSGQTQQALASNTWATATKNKR